MCMTCGCGKPHDSHGNPAYLTVEDLDAAARAAGRSLPEAVESIVATLAIHEREGREPDGGRAGEGLARPAGPRPAPAAPRGTPGSES